MGQKWVSWRVVAETIREQRRVGLAGEWSAANSNNENHRFQPARVTQSKLFILGRCIAED